MQASQACTSPLCVPGTLCHVCIPSPTRSIDSHYRHRDRAETRPRAPVEAVVALDRPQQAVVQLHEVLRTVDAVDQAQRLRAVAQRASAHEGSGSVRDGLRPSDSICACCLRKVRDHTYWVNRARARCAREGGEQLQARGVVQVSRSSEWRLGRAYKASQHNQVPSMCRHAVILLLMMTWEGEGGKGGRTGSASSSASTTISSTAFALGCEYTCGRSGSHETSARAPSGCHDTAVIT